MDKMKPDFIKRCVTIGLVNERQATTIFSQLEKFAEYGFNKSHSAAYALVSFQTAWLKCRYPVEFMAALMTSEMSDKEKIAELIHECRVENIKVFPPDVNSSGYKFTVKDGKILFGLGAIKGVGQGAIDAIIEARKKKEFKDFFDFSDRVEDKKVNKRVLEALILSGALDASGGADRGTMLASLESVLEKKKRDKFKPKGLTYNTLFGAGAYDKENLFTEAEPLTDTQRLSYEKDFLGFYVTGHPMAKYETLSQALDLDSIQSILKMKTQNYVRILGTISGIKVRVDKNKKQFAFATMEDITGKAEVILWSKAFERYRDLLIPERVMVAIGQSDPPKADSMYGTKIVIDELFDLEEDLSKRVKSVTFSVPLEKLKTFSDFLSQKEFHQRNGGPVFYLKIKDTSGYGIYRLDESPHLDVALVNEAYEILRDRESVSLSLTPTQFEKAFGLVAS
jgi:DNA polymerase-3 subunit alpha